MGRVLRPSRNVIAGMLLLVASAALPQGSGEDGITTTTLEPVSPDRIENEIETGNGVGATLRMLDFLSGRVDDLAVAQGEVLERGFLTLELLECRYPVENPDADAFARLIIHDLRDDDEPRFDGWMVASSPALSALDHPRYDVWVIRCTISDG